MMTTAEARTLAQSDPVPNLTASLGQIAANTRKTVDTLVLHLRALDNAQGQLADHNIEVTVDLGPIGNAAAAARRDLEKQRDTTTFELPR